MIAQLFIITIVLQQCHQTSSQLNFSDIGLTWQSNALYVLYNNQTTKKNQFLDYVDDILEGGQGYFAQRPYALADITESKKCLKALGSYSIKSLVVVMMSNTLDPVWQKAVEITRFMRQAGIIFVIAEDIHGGRGTKMHNLFNNLWREQFRRVLAITRWNGDILSMIPYPKIEIRNVTNNLTREYFPSRASWDLKGYILNVPVQRDVPNIFWYYDPKIHRIRIDGVGGRIFEHFMAALNVKLEVYPILASDSNSINMDIIEELIMGGYMEISPHWDTTFEAKNMSYSYFYETTPRCFILPMDNIKFNKLFPMYWAIWAVILLFVATVEIILRLSCKHISRCSRLSTPGTLTFSIICILIAYPLPFKQIFNIQNMSKRSFVRIFILYYIIIVGGFCFAQIYSTTLTSRLAASYHIGSSITPNDILDMDKMIMIPIEDVKFLIYASKFGPRAMSKIYFTSYEMFHQHRLSMNTSFIYPISLERWSIVKEQQLFLKYKRFWLSNICYGKYPMQFQMRHDSIFQPYLQRFELYMREGGLDMAWKRHAIKQVMKMGYMRYFNDSEQDVMEQKRGEFNRKLRYMLVYIYAGGLVLSSVVFAMEVLSKKYGKCERM